jgi:colanic acid biosynthesis glycosyl transferase WcaI
MAALVRKRVNRTPVVLHLQDLIPESAVEVGLLSNATLVRAAYRCADWTYKQCDLVTAIGERFLETIAAREVETPLALLPNWVDTDWIRPDADGARWRALSSVASDSFLVQYVGNLGFKQSMRTLAAAGRILCAEDPSVQTLIVGDGSDRHALEAELARHPSEQVRLMGVQDRELLPAMLAAADIHVVHQLRSVTDMVVPSKLLTYAASGRPIVFAGSRASEGARFVTEAQCGMVVPPENPKVLANALLELRSDPDARRRFGRNGREHVTENYGRSRLLDQAEQILLDVAGAHR